MEGNSVYDYDRGKIVLFSKGINCTEIGDILRDRYKIELEMSSATHLIAMTTVSDSEEGFNRLVKAIVEIDNEISGNNEKIGSFVYPKPQVEINSRDAFNMDKEDVHIEKSEGRICGEFIIPYPPGIPLLSPGEKVSIEVLQIIKNLKRCSVNVIGMKNSSLEKITVLK